MADKLVELGLSKLGYTYVNIDDCWSEIERGPTGELREDKSRFPHGISWLSEYIHSKGLHFGMYTDIGTKTCGGYPGLAGGHLHQDVDQFVSWKIDSLKVDGCYANVEDMSVEYSALSQVLNSTKRPILYSCSWPAYQGDHCENPQDMETLKAKCNLWRNYGDIDDSWISVESIVKYWARTTPEDIMVSAAGPGHWNDPDMLLVGNPGLSISEQRAQFALWAILAAPLYISTDLRSISSDTLSILINEEVIAINQDPAGRQGYVLSDESWYRTWVRPLGGGSDKFAVLFENKGTAFDKIRFHFLPTKLGWTVNDRYTARDVHSHTDVVTNGSCGNIFIVDVDESSVEMFVFQRSHGGDTAENLPVIISE
jgi:alpha-N-acetylgalactosaminidase